MNPWIASYLKGKLYVLKVIIDAVFFFFFFFVVVCFFFLLLLFTIFYFHLKNYHFFI